MPNRALKAYELHAAQRKNIERVGVIIFEDNPCANAVLDALEKCFFGFRACMCFLHRRWIHDE